jgi:hypothetical protein
VPKSTVSSKKLYREFSKLHERYVGRNFLKNLRFAYSVMYDKYNITPGQVEFLLFVYDLEFFTIRYLGGQWGLDSGKLAERVIYPCVNAGYVYKHFDKMTPPEDHVDQMMRKENKFNYRVRYALSQQGRLMVQRFYRILENPNSTS